MNEILLVYDKQCPLCDAYCRMTRIRDDVGELKIVNARDHSPIMEEITALGLDIDQGMVLKIGDQHYYGSDAIQALAMISSRSGVFNRLTYYMFRSQKAARILYPVLRSMRNVLLKLLGRTKINNLKLENNERF